ncbi:MAG: prephenate dehydratase [Candidatus Lokiarchaeota archaeon]|nr:prephenate dehydratase [Candidatus Lokiarchaeota archaeon]
MNEIEKKRTDIDKIDEELMELLNQRAKIARDIGALKKNRDLEVYQPEREQQVIDHLKSKTTILHPENIEAIWKEIIGACKAVQDSILKVGYFGPQGTFTHQAALAFFPKAGTKFIPLKTISDVFEKVDKGEMKFGVVPIENTLQGTVRDTLDLLIEKDLIIYGEIELRIVQNLITLKDTSMAAIKEIYSHPQGFAQTRMWTKTNLPNAKLLNASSTAEAVKIVKERNDPSNAAIGPEIASKIYDLNVLNSNIEDNPSNYTRFLIISKEQNKLIKEKVKTSIVFVTKHIPGALYGALKLFADANINLLKIESRPRRKGKWEYIFLMDFEGDTRNDPKIRHLLDDLKNIVIWYKVLGSYPMN